MKSMAYISSHLRSWKPSFQSGLVWLEIVVNIMVLIEILVIVIGISLNDWGPHMNNYGGCGSFIE